jgi:hypothetical protein
MNGFCFLLQTLQSKVKKGAKRKTNTPLADLKKGQKKYSWLRHTF